MTKTEHWLEYGILFMIAIAPTQRAFEVFPQTYLSLVDPLLALLACLGLWLIHTGRAGKRVHAPSPFVFLFIAWGALSIPGAAGKAAALKGVLQWTLYFVVAWMLFRYALDSERFSRKALKLATAIATLILVYALWQFFHPGIPDIKVGSSFGNRNVLAGFLALTLPFAFARSLVDDSPTARLTGLIVTLAGMMALLSGAAAIGIIISMLAMAALRGKMSLGLTLIWAFLIVVALHPKLPRRDGFEDPWLDSIALHDTEGELSRRYPEWESAWLLMNDHPWRGVGAGNYQENISSYRRIPTPPGAPEPDTQNLYLVLGASIGAPGLLAFLAMLFEGMAGAAAASRIQGRLSMKNQALALGAFGSLLAFAITAIWHPLLVRGVGIPLAGVLAMAAHLKAKSEPG